MIKFEIKNKKLLELLKNNNLLDQINIENMIMSGINFCVFLHEFKTNEKTTIENLKINIQMNDIKE